MVEENMKLSINRINFAKKFEPLIYIVKNFENKLDIIYNGISEFDNKN